MKLYGIFFAVCCSQLVVSESFAEPQKKLVIGVLAPLTGGPAEQGEWVLQGAEIAKEAAAADGIEVELRVEDTQADPKLAVGAFQKLNSLGRLDGIITYGSGVGVALSAPSNQSKVIQMGVATSTPAYKSADDFTFRNFPSAELESTFLVQQALRLNPQPNIAIVRINNEYGLGTAKAFTAELEKAGGRVATEELLEPAAGEYRTQIARLKTKNANIIYLGSYPNEGALFLKQAKEMGLTVPFVASVAIVGAKNFFALAGGGAEGLLIGSSTPLYMEDSSKEIREFNERYLKRYGIEPSVQQMYAARAYDGVRAMVFASKQCPEHDTSCMKEKLFSMQNLSGPSGTLTFDRNGDVATEFSLLRVRDGKFERAD